MCLSGFVEVEVYRRKLQNTMVWAVRVVFRFTNVKQCDRFLKRSSNSLGISYVFNNPRIQNACFLTINVYLLVL